MKALVEAFQILPVSCPAFSPLEEKFTASIDELVFVVEYKQGIIGAGSGRAGCLRIVPST